MQHVSPSVKSDSPFVRPDWCQEEYTCQRAMPVLHVGIEDERERMVIWHTCDSYSCPSCGPGKLAAKKETIFLALDGLEAVYIVTIPRESWKGTMSNSLRRRMGRERKKTGAFHGTISITLPADMMVACTLIPRGVNFLAMNGRDAAGYISIHAQKVRRVSIAGDFKEVVREEATPRVWKRFATMKGATMDMVGQALTDLGIEGKRLEGAIVFRDGSVKEVVSRVMEGGG